MKYKMIVSKRYLMTLCCLVSTFLLSAAKLPESPLNLSSADYESRTLDDPSLRKYMQNMFGEDLEEWPLKKWDLEQLTLAAFFNHPDLEISRGQWQIDTTSRKVASARPNWLLQNQPRYAPSPSDGKSPWYTQNFLSFVIETGGKRKYRMRQAKHLAEVSHINIMQSAWQLRSRLRTNFVLMLTAQKSLEILKSQLENQELILTGIEKRLSVGEGSMLEVNLEKIKLNEIKVQISNNEKSLKEAQVLLAEAVGITTEHLLEKDFADEWFLNPVEIEDIGQMDLRREAAYGRSDLMAMLEEYQAADAALKLATAQKYPDIRIGPGFLFNRGQNLWALVLDLFYANPLSSKGSVNQALAHRNQVANRFTALQTKIISSVDFGYSSYQSSILELGNSKSLIEQSKSQNKLLKKQFEIGEIDIIPLKQSEIIAYQAQINTISSLQRTQVALGTLEDALQRPIKEMPYILRQLDFSPKLGKIYNEKN
jgi:cobalt-zinc-cadmium efflux system outer membrane protein